jgi:DNA-binding NtrC family response regulator
MVKKNVPNVFVVDDERAIAETLSMILQRSGYAAKFFTNPKEALRAARTETPDLLLTDVVMPELSGIDLAISVQKGCPDCKVLLFSGQADTVDLLLDARKRGHHFKLLPKPIHPTEILRHVREQDPAWTCA